MVGVHVNRIGNEADVAVTVDELDAAGMIALGTPADPLVLV
jgi:hypothetical protein